MIIVILDLPLGQILRHSQFQVFEALSLNGRFMLALLTLYLELDPNISSFLLTDSQASSDLNVGVKFILHSLVPQFIG